MFCLERERYEEREKQKLIFYSIRSYHQITGPTEMESEYVQLKHCVHKLN